jgi:hypothetical protein
MLRLLNITFLLGLMTGLVPAMAQAPVRPTPPTRDPHAPGYVTATDLPDGANAPPKADGNFILGPTHNPAPEMTAQEGVPRGAVFTFTMESADSKIYPGIAREPNTFAVPDPADPNKVIVNSYPAPYTRRVAVYVPKQYVPGTEAPFIVGADGPDRTLFTALDNLIAEHRVPVMIAISIGNGSGDAQGSQRGLEYDTMSGLYAEFVEKEVLSLVEKMQREAHQGSRRAGDDGVQLRRSGRDGDGLVSHGSLPPCSELLGHVRVPAVAVQPRDPARRMGVP